MSIDNIALVRATNVVPFDGIMKPISESPYLRQNTNLEFSRGIRQMLIEEGVISEVDFSKFNQGLHYGTAQ